MRTAHVDEAGSALPGGGRLYVVAAVLSSTADHPAITAALREHLVNVPVLHFHTESDSRRTEIAKVIADFPLHGAILVTTPTSHREQEDARRRLMCELLPRLYHVEGVRQVVVESRAGSDVHDRKVLNRLRRSHQVPSELRVDHRNKNEPMLWVADWVASSYIAAIRHAVTEPWELINAAHAVEVTAIKP
ncbi:hypothetical protein [Crossiella sp. CA198]|uniref:hypothetical protein n=1 Tax=Crossiella sp. CA198 TaxID=3455607 RepID=UPI003F8D12AB